MNLKTIFLQNPNNQNLYQVTIASFISVKSKFLKILYQIIVQFIVFIGRLIETKKIYFPREYILIQCFYSFWLHRVNGNFQGNKQLKQQQVKRIVDRMIQIWQFNSVVTGFPITQKPVHRFAIKQQCLNMVDLCLKLLSNLS